MTEPKNGYVKWQVFVWVMGIILVAFGWLFMRSSATEGKVDSVQAHTADLKADVGIIKNDVQWIKETLQKGAKASAQDILKIP